MNVADSKIDAVATARGFKAVETVQVTNSDRTLTTTRYSKPSKKKDMYGDDSVQVTYDSNSGEVTWNHSYYDDTNNWQSDSGSTADGLEKCL